jgi:hypothetical protein
VVGNHVDLIITSPLPIIAEQSHPIVIGFIRVYVHQLNIYIVFGCHVPPVKFVGRYTTLVGIQLPVHNLVYAVEPGVPSPYNAYLIFPSLGLCVQKSDVINHPHCQLAEVCVRIFEAHQSIPIIANAKIAKA